MTNLKNISNGLIIMKININFQRIHSHELMSRLHIPGLWLSPNAEGLRAKICKAVLFFGRSVRALANARALSESVSNNCKAKSA